MAKDKCYSNENTIRTRNPDELGFHRGYKANRFAVQ